MSPDLDFYSLCHVFLVLRFVLFWFWRLLIEAVNSILLSKSLTLIKMTTILSLRLMGYSNQRIVMTLLRKGCCWQHEFSRRQMSALPAIDSRHQDSPRVTDSVSGWKLPVTQDSKRLRLKRALLQKWKPLVMQTPTATSTDPVVDSSLTQCHEKSIASSQAASSQSGSSSSRNTDETPEGLPSSDKLDTIFRELSEGLPRLFVQTHNFRLYTHDLIFEDNIRRLKTKGINDYMINISMLKIKAHLSYSSVGLKLLKITKHEDEGTVKVRWQIRGISGWRVIFTFWRYMPTLYNKGLSEQPKSDIYDGFSTFYVNSDGKIYRHTADKMMPDDERVTVTNPLSKMPVNLI